MEDNVKISKGKVGFVEVFVLVFITFCVSLSLGVIIGKYIRIDKKVEKVDKNIQMFIDNYKYIVSNYYDEIDKDDLINKAIEGMMNSLDDPYSAYIDSETSTNFNATLDGNYQGLGISIVKNTDNNYIQVVYTFEGSPAEKAGIKSGDIIKSIDGKDTTEMETSELSNMVINSEKKEFKLILLRDDEEIEIVVSKDNIVLDSVESKIYERDNKKIGYIYISIFANNTAEQFIEKLNELEDEEIDSLIIDVRSNTGGHLTAVEEILNNLLTNRQITYQLDKSGEVTKYYGKLNENKKYGIVLLGDSYSASASEVLISSLRENLDAKLVGEKTYGKGTVQELITLSNGQQYKITTKKWLTPDGNWVNDTEGILPDIEEKLNEEYYKSLSEDDDNQLQKAIEIAVEQGDVN